MAADRVGGVVSDHTNLRTTAMTLAGFSVHVDRIGSPLLPTQDTHSSGVSPKRPRPFGDPPPAGVPAFRDRNGLTRQDEA